MAKEFSPDYEVQQIAEKLIEILKPELEGFEIRYVRCSENPKKDGRKCIGLARKVSGFYAFLAGSTGDFFVIETGEPAYEALSTNQKIAYVHHELCHFGITELGHLAILPHDIEEFNEIAEVHGAYFDRLQIFADAVEKGNSDNSGRAELIKQILEN
jgi:predicted metallopeptidase